MKYVCNVCGWEYDEAVGVPTTDCTRHKVQFTDDFVCPLCG